MKFISKFIYRILGWKTEGSIPKGLKKYVIVAAPHTSNWDFFYGRLYFYMHNIPLKYFIKKELFFFPLGLLLKAMGGIPVNRKKKGNFTRIYANEFKKHKHLALLVTPEGTRGYSPNWKKGFYFIAKQASVPIVLGYIDYERKVGGIGPVIIPSGNYEKDLKMIKDFYRDKKGRFPENGVR